jgi:hypothetical protein
MQTYLNKQNRPGAAVLTLLVAVVILLMLYFLSTSAIFRPSRIPKSSRPENRPWLEEDRIVSPDVIIDLPDSPKPELNENLSIIAAVTLNGQDRGQLDLDFDTQGRVRCFWESSFSQENRRTTFEAESEGNIDISKTYTDKEKQDGSLLYFITKGTYTERVDNIKTGQTTSTEGIIYVTGYLTPGYDVFGQMTITTDKSWSVSYEFNSKPQDSASFGDDK